jgi:hypothetical protein
METKGAPSFSLSQSPQGLQGFDTATSYAFAVTRNQRARTSPRSGEVARETLLATRLFHVLFSEISTLDHHRRVIPCAQPGSSHPRARVAQPCPR